MIIHLFNSSSVSGPERLVLPALAAHAEHFMIVNLREERIGRLNASDPLERYAHALKLSYRAIRVRGRWDSVAISELQLLVLELQPDLVHAHAIKASAYLAQAKRNPLLSNFPIVSTHHGVHGLPDWKVRVYEWLYRRYFLKRFDRILAVSTADYEFLLASGIDKEKLALHRNGINARWVSAQDRTQESKRIRALWLPNEPGRDRLFLFGVVARLSREKDHARLLRVLALLNQKSCDRDWRCLVFGEGALEKKLRADTRRLGIEDRLRWMGYRKTVGDELAGLDLLLSFSKAEGLPINVIEAGWAGTPVMATLVGGLHDLLPDDRFGTRFPLKESDAQSAERLQFFLSNAGRLRLDSQAAHFQERILREFTQDQWIERLAAIYAGLEVAFASSNERGAPPTEALCL